MKRSWSIIMLLASMVMGSCAPAQAIAEVPLQPAVATSVPTEPLAKVPVTAIPVPGFRPALSTPEHAGVPTASPAERQIASDTWLYISAFEASAIFVVDPASGHALHEIPIVGGVPGLAVSPDGQRLYVVDGHVEEGYLRIFDTATWQVIHQERIPDRALLIAGNPISLSGDGRWLVVDHYSYSQDKAWSTIFDIQSLRFQSHGAQRLSLCPRPLQVLGKPGHQRLYVDCGGFVAGLDSASMQPLWMADSPKEGIAAVTLSPKAGSLYGLYPKVTFDFTYTANDGHGGVTGTALRLFVWDTTAGQLIQAVNLSDQVRVPLATSGRGDAGYLTISPDGQSLYVAWEDTLWMLSPESLEVTGELKLPAPVDGMAISREGHELYLLPAYAGDLTIREKGLWTVDARALTLERHASNWPLMFVFAMFAAPAPLAEG